ncbi:alpha/beta hydrolase family protein [Flindersiella endophytica]
MYPLAELDPTCAPPLLPAGDPAAWPERRARISKVWQEYVGALPEPLPVSWRTLGEERLPAADASDASEASDAVTRLRIEYDAPPGWDAAGAERVTAYLLIPDSARREPAPAALAPHPTHQRGKDVVSIPGVGVNRDYGWELARRGYVVLAPDIVGSGDRLAPGEDYWDTSGFYRRNPGWTIIGRMLVDHRQGVDLLAGLPEVDASRIVAIGHSLGGYNSVFLAGLDERIRATVSSCGTSMWAGDPHPGRWFRGQPFIHLPRLADDFDAGVMPFEWHEIAALVAPRPLLVFSTREDDCFPHYESVAAGMAEVRKLYTALERPQDFEFLLGSGRHDFPPYVRQAAYAFLDAVVRPR